MEHTPTPWHAPGIGEICDQSGRVIAICIDCNPVEEDLRPDPALEEGDANSRRIVACINAMAGIDDDNVLFRRGSIGTVRKHIVTQQVQIEKLTAQRDELLAVLEGLLDEVADCMCTYEMPARAVIQKVSGGE